MNGWIVILVEVGVFYMFLVIWGLEKGFYCLIGIFGFSILLISFNRDFFFSFLLG